MRQQLTNLNCLRFQNLEKDEMDLLMEWLSVFCIGLAYDAAVSIFKGLIFSSYDEYFGLQVDAKTSYGPSRPDPIPPCPFYSEGDKLLTRPFERVSKCCLRLQGSKNILFQKINILSKKL